MAPLFVRWLLVPTSVGPDNDVYAQTRALVNTHAEATVRGGHKGKSLKRGCCTVAFDSFCGTTKTSENNRHFFGFAWAWLALGGRKAIPRLLAKISCQERPEHARPGHTCARNDPRAPEKSVQMSKKRAFRT